MTKTKTTKRALLSSALVLILCIALLVGTTFAWFTDSVTSAGNIIKSGNLDVTMEWFDGTKVVPDADSTDWIDASSEPIFDYELWEPGYVSVRHIKIANEGSLALKYQLNIVANGAVSELADVIDVYYLDPAAQVANRTALTADKKLGTLTDVLADIDTTASGNLLANTNHTVTLALKMQESAGNEYQNKAIGSTFSVQLLATQLTSEFDSFDNQYDVDADYTASVATADELAAALQAGGKIQVTDNITLSETLEVGAGATASIDLNGKTITAASNGYAFYNQEGGTLIFDDAAGKGVVEGVVYTGSKSSTVVNAGTFNAVDGGKYVFLNESGSLTVNEATVSGGSSYPLYSYGNGHKLIINDVNVSGPFGCVNTYSDGTVEINGGSFTATGTKNKTHHCIYVGSGAKLVINDGTFAHKGNGISDSGATLTVYAGANGGATINGGTFIGGGYIKAFDKYDSSCYLVINGGTFSNDPSKYVPQGHVTINNNDGTYTVVEGVAVKDAAGLQQAIDDASATEETTINLVSGTYDQNLDLTVAALGASKGDLVFKAAPGAEVVLSGTVTLGYRKQGTGAAMMNGDVTFEGITFDQANAATHSLDVQDVHSLTLKDCTIIGDGEYGINSANGNATGKSSIVNCTFVNAGMQIKGNFGTGLVIDGCTFNNSRVNVQGGNGVTVQNCTFNDTLTDAKLADSFYLVRSNSTPITVKNCDITVDSTVTGVATGQEKWGIFWNRGTTNWTVQDVNVTLTKAALAQTDLLVTKTTSTGKINTTNLKVNGVTK